MGRYKVMSQMSGKTWSFETREERDAFASELAKDGFEARHGVYKWDPEEELEANPYKGIIARAGNCWY